MFFMKHITLSLAFFSAVGTSAQDQLFKRDNSKTEVKVLEVTPGEVKYKLFSYQDGPTITVMKSEVALIIYQDGRHETFNVPASQQAVLVYRDDATRKRLAIRSYRDSLKLVKYREATSTKNLVSLNLLEPLNSSISISYLREFAGGLFHVYAPLSVGFSKPFFNQPNNTIFGSQYYNYNGIYNFTFNRKTVDAGLGIHIHASPKRLMTYVIGPYIGIAQYTGSYDYKIDDPGFVAVLGHKNFVLNRYSFMLDNGILFRVHKNFNMLLMAGLGYRSDNYIANDPKDYMSSNYGNYKTGFPFEFPFSRFPINTFKLNLSVGYRF